MAHVLMAYWLRSGPVPSLSMPVSAPSLAHRRSAIHGSLREAPRTRVLHWIETSIESGEFGPGDPIPAERTLAGMLGVARNTVAAALDEAERRRLVMRYSPNARKRFVPTPEAKAALPSSAICVMGAKDPFVDGRPAPRWTDRYLSIDLLSRLSRTGKHVLFLNGGSLSEPDVDSLFASPPAGMIVVNAVSGHPLAMRALECCRKASVPVVVYGNAPELQTFDRVFTDHRAGGREVVQWLIERGCRRIVPMLPGAPAEHWMRERLAGYDEAMRKAGLEPTPAVVFGAEGLGALPLEEQFRIHRALAMERLVALRANGPLDAIVCLTDHWAKPVIAAMRDLGIVPNRDILVSGYDHIGTDSEFGSFESEFPIVTVDKHNERTAEDMARLLVARMAGELPPEPQLLTHPHELVVRTDLTEPHPDKDNAP